MRILVVEDEVKLAGHLARALEQDGHDARIVHDGKVGLVEARDGTYDLIVLDVELPRMDGFEVMKQLRGLGVESRILMLTARGEMPDKIAGLKNGADDYLTKPFAMNELLARVNALGRRFVAPTGRTLQVGDLILKLDEREAWRGERCIELSERECALLNVLMREPGRVFSRVELSERVWSREHEYDTKLVEVFIGRLRKKIDEGASAPLIKTERHLGYSLQDPSPPCSPVRSAGSSSSGLRSSPLAPRSFACGPPGFCFAIRKSRHSIAGWRPMPRSFFATSKTSRVSTSGSR